MSKDLRFARKVDKIQPALVEELRSCGVRVAVTSALGNGFPDVVCLYHGLWTPLELKNSEKEKLTEHEERWWAKMGEEPHIAWDLESASRWLPELHFSTQGTLFKKKRKRK